MVARRAILKGMAATGLPARRIDQRAGLEGHRAGVGPAPGGQIIIARTVVVKGPGGGVFTYDASNNLRTANVGQTTTDPIQHNTAYAGYSTFNGHGAVISLFSSTLDAQFWYLDTGTSTQGALDASVATTTGTDPFGKAYLAGFVSYNGNLRGILNQAQLQLGQTTDFAFGSVAAASGQLTLSSGTRDNVDNAAGLTLESTEASPTGLILIRAPFGTGVGQFVIGTGAVATSALLEVQGSGNFSGRLGVNETAFATAAELEVKGAVAPTDPAVEIVPNAATDQVLGSRLAADTNNRIQVDGNGAIGWGSGAAATDSSLVRSGANLMQFRTCDLGVAAVGRGLRVREGANCKQGTATLAAGTILVADTAVTASSRIFLTPQDNNTTGALRVSARVVGTSFTITSSNAADTGVVAFEIFEPG